MDNKVGYPAPYDVYVPNTETSARLLTGWSRYDSRNTVQDYINSGYDFLDIESGEIVTELVLSGEYPLDQGGFVMQRKGGSDGGSWPPLPYGFKANRYVQVYLKEAKDD